MLALLAFNFSFAAKDSIMIFKNELDKCLKEAKSHIVTCKGQGNGTKWIAPQKNWQRTRYTVSMLPQSISVITACYCGCQTLSPEYF